MAGARMKSLKLSSAVALVLSLTLTLTALGNNPDGSHPYWEGPFGERVDAYTNELALPAVDVSLPTRGGLPLALVRTYCSELYQTQPDTLPAANCLDLRGTPTAYSPFGLGWHLPVVRIDSNKVFYSDGQYEPFFRDFKNRKRTRAFAVVTSESSTELILTYTDGTRWIFDKDTTFSSSLPEFNGRYLKRIEDHTTLNYVTYTYHKGAGGLLTEMRDQSERYIKLYYNNYVQLEDARIDSLEYKGVGGQTRKVFYSYSGGYLTSVLYPDGSQVNYAYADSVYCSGSWVDIPLSRKILASVQFPTGGKAKYHFERFSEKVWNAQANRVNYIAHFAPRKIEIDSAGTTYTHADFVRYYASTELINDSLGLQTTVYTSCDSGAANSKLAEEWDFSERWVNYDPSSGTAEQQHFRAGLLISHRIFNPVIGLGSNFEETYHYWNWQNDTTIYWKLIKIGRDDTPGAIDTSIWFPHLRGFKRRLEGSPGWDHRKVYSNARMDPYTGITLSYQSNRDSVFQILDKVYDTTANALYIKRTHFDGFDHLFVYDTTAGGVPIDPLVRKRFLVSTGSPRDSIGQSFDYDSLGNLILAYDHLGNVASRIEYDQATRTFPYITVRRLGLVDTTIFDTNLGLLTTRISSNGTRFEYEYDGADRLIRFRRVGDAYDNLRRYYKNDHRTVVDSILVDSSPVKYRLETRLYGLFSGLQKISVDSMELGLIGYPASVVDYEYNRQLQLRRGNRAHASTDSSGTYQWTHYRYDYRGRPLFVDYPNTINADSTTSSNIVRYTYSGDQRSQYDWLSRKSTSRYDVIGRLAATYFDSTAAVTFRDSTVYSYAGNTDLLTSVTMPGPRTISYTYDRFRHLRAVTEPDQGTDNFFYDKAGNLRFKQDANGIWTAIRYDSLFRLIEIVTASSVDTTRVDSLSYMPNGTSQVSYVYGRYDFTRAADTLTAFYGDSYNSHQWIKGMLTQVNDQACTTLFLYDRQGRVAKKYVHYNPVAKWAGGPTVAPGFKLLAYKYTPTDNIESFRFPRETGWIDYEYDRAGMLRRIPALLQPLFNPSNPAVYYKPWGSVSSTAYKNGVTDQTVYDNLSRPQRMVSAYSIPYQFGEVYNYSAHRLTRVDKLTSGSSGAPITRIYYDYRDRVDSVNHLDQGEVAAYGYEYDAANNRTEVRKWVSGSLNTRTYHNYYSNSDLIKNTSATSGDGVVKYTYDSHGNTLSDSTKKLSYAYNFVNMIDTIVHVNQFSSAKRDTVVYGYNYQNQRVWKLTKRWNWGPCSWPSDSLPDDPQSLLVPDQHQSTRLSEMVDDIDLSVQTDTTSDTCLVQYLSLKFYVWSGDEVVAEYDAADTLINQFVYANGRLAVQFSYLGFGAKDTFYIHQDILRTNRLITDRTGTTAALEYHDIWGILRSFAGGEKNEYRYIGREGDDMPWEDHYYLRNRFYNVDIGRFLTPDPVLSDYNPYSYAFNSPMMFTDRSGLTSSSWVRFLFLWWYNWGLPTIAVDGQTVTARRPHTYGGASGNAADPWYIGEPTSGEPNSGPGNQGGSGGQGGGGGAPRKEMRNEKGQTLEEVKSEMFHESGSISFIEWILRVMPSGDWDIKSSFGYSNDNEYLGNFAYGMTGTRQGLPAGILLRAAGIVQVVQNLAAPGRHPTTGSPWGGSPYGDAEHDQSAIREGIRFINDLNLSLSNPDSESTRVRY